MIKLILPIFFFLIGCSILRNSSGLSICPESQTIRVGIDQELLSQGSMTPDEQSNQINSLKSLLAKTIQCPLEVGLISTTQIGKRNIREESWDFAFLSPTLSVIALEQQSKYVPLRILGQDAASRSSILVSKKSSIKDYADLSNKRLGLLPGSLTGYYLPRYNLHGIHLGEIKYASSNQELLSLLKEEKVDAIAWDTGIKPYPAETRIAAVDNHLLPPGGLFMHSRLNGLDYPTFLKAMDESSFQIPPFLRYGAETKPEIPSYQHFIKIVRHVDQLDRDKLTPQSQ